DEERHCGVAQGVDRRRGVARAARVEAAARSARAIDRSAPRRGRRVRPSGRGARRGRSWRQRTMMTTTPASLAEAAGLIERREVSPVELTRACLERIAAGNDELRAFITVMTDRALADAARAEKDIAKGRYLGPLHGMPVSVKDLVDIAGTPTTSGSAVPPRHPRHDAPVVSRL